MSAALLAATGLVVIIGLAASRGESTGTATLGDLETAAASPTVPDEEFVAAKVCLSNVISTDERERGLATAAAQDYNDGLRLSSFDGFSELASRLEPTSIIGCPAAFAQLWRAYVGAWQSYGNFIENHTGVVHIASGEDVETRSARQNALMDSQAELLALVDDYLPDLVHSRIEFPS